jgi:enoyl-CoA hydratase/carnithine racemase
MVVSESGTSLQLLEQVLGDGVVTLLWNRPEKRNALSTELYRATSDAIARHSIGATRVIILGGCGSVFCAGMDFNDAMLSSSHTKAARAFMMTLESCPKIVIAAIHGKCVGIGATLLLHCDYVLASNDTTLATPFASLGIPPEFGSTFMFPQFLGRALAIRMLFGGEAVNVSEWYAAGAVTQVLDKHGQDVVTHAVAYARHIAADKPADEWNAVLRAKQIMKATMRPQIRQAIRDEFEEIDRAFASGVPEKLIKARIAAITKSRARM